MVIQLKENCNIGQEQLVTRKHQPMNANIHHVNYKGEYDPVTIVDKILWSNVYGGEITEYAIFPTWNHWPVAQMPSDGRYASYPDRTCHSSLSHIFPPDYSEQF